MEEGGSRPPSWTGLTGCRADRAAVLVQRAFGVGTRSPVARERRDAVFTRRKLTAGAGAGVGGGLLAEAGDAAKRVLPAVTDVAVGPARYAFVA